MCIMSGTLKVNILLKLCWGIDSMVLALPFDGKVEIKSLLSLECLAYWYGMSNL